MVAGVPLVSRSTVDLGDPRTYELVRRIFYRRFSTRVSAAGIDPEDALQEVYLGLLTRSRSVRSAWDPRRGGLSTWVYVATSGLVINLVDKHRNRNKAHVGDAQDVASDDHRVSDETVGHRAAQDLAAEMDVPVAVVVAMAGGEDPFCAALDAGLDFWQANRLTQDLGLR